MTHRFTTLRSRYPVTSRVALLVVVAVVFTLLTSLVDGNAGVAPLSLLSEPRFALANALPGLLLAGLLLVMTRRVLLSFGLTLLLQTLVYGVNAIKVAELGTPLIPADFRMVGQLRQGGMHLLGGYLPHSPWPYLALLTGVALVVALWRYEPPLFARYTRGKRLLSGGVLALTLGTLLAGASAWASFYNSRHLWLEPWSAAATTEHSGLVSSLLMFHLQYGNAKQNADPAAAHHLLGQTAEALRQRMQVTPDQSTALPDIVVI
ncbi:MAG: LTA synthase family protein, partial [Rhodanobacter sp.]